MAIESHQWLRVKGNKKDGAFSKAIHGWADQTWETRMEEAIVGNRKPRLELGKLRQKFRLGKPGIDFSSPPMEDVNYLNEPFDFSATPLIIFSKKADLGCYHPHGCRSRSF